MSAEKPLVAIWVEDGIAYYKVIRGDVEVLQWDWDLVDEGEEEEIRGYVAQVEQLPDDYPEKAEILDEMRKALIRFEEPPGDNPWDSAYAGGPYSGRKNS